MKNVFRWVAFTAVVTAVGLVLTFGLLVLSRFYADLGQAAFVLTVLTLFSMGVTIAAINFASKLEDEAGREIDAGGYPAHPTRAIAEGEDPDGRR